MTGSGFAPRVLKITLDSSSSNETHLHSLRNVLLTVQNKTQIIKRLQTPVCFIRAACRMVEQFFPSHTFSDVVIGRAVFNDFSEYPKKLMIWHSHPLCAVIGQLCGRGRVRRVWISLSTLFFNSCHNCILSLFMWSAEYSAVKAFCERRQGPNHSGSSSVLWGTTGSYGWRLQHLLY